MANAKKCDVCGKFYIPACGMAATCGYHLTFTASFLRSSVEYDLCDDCQKKLKDFVESMKGDE